MKNLFKLLFLGLVIGLVFSNCKKEDDPTVDEFEVLAQYMQDDSLDLAKINGGFAKAGTGINVNTTDFSVPDYYVIDIRSAADFDLGHIKNAVNSTLANILTTAEGAGGKPILVVCYTGQTAGRGVAALRLKGYEAYTLKWGMCAWHSNFNGKWESNATDFVSANWLTTGDPAATQTFTAFPEISTGETEGEKILDAQIAKMLANTSWMVTKDVVLANPENYFINNYWSATDWTNLGHIKGAYRIKDELKLDGLKYLDPSETILTYCYTGQTSAITNAWLEVLGYNAVSLGFGTNSIIHSNMLAGTADVVKVSWGGTGAGSNLNFGYYDKNGNYYEPVP